MTQQEIDALSNTFRRQGLTWYQTNLAVSVVRNLVEAAQKNSYEAGWRNAAKWANRGDLVADIGSPAYLKDFREAAIAAQKGGAE